MTASTAASTVTGAPAHAELCTSATTQLPAGRSRAQGRRIVVAGLVLATFGVASYTLGHAVGSDQPSGDRPGPPPVTAPAAAETTSDPGLCRLGRAC
jgi:hypothetical protein